MPYLLANWKAAPSISALTTLRRPGMSQGPFAENNLGLHVEDEPNLVLQNRDLLRKNLQLPNEPEWLEQIHSNLAVVVENDENRRCDASISRAKDRVLAIMTADCLPILLTNQEGTEIAAIHAGWRGLMNGIIENTCQKLQTKPRQLIAWIGPSICQNCFEVGLEVKQLFAKAYPFSSPYFLAKEDKWLANLAALAEAILLKLGIFAVYQAKSCTFEEKNDFYSYRRQAQTGRMVTLIWFNDNKQG